ncbi:MAG: hypothetical protein L3K23_05655 [Thermoplasmata archaeon]|nr:hypothetical protein [Thermoplasmata archaeon]
MSIIDSHREATERRVRIANSLIVVGVGVMVVPLLFLASIGLLPGLQSRDSVFAVEIWLPFLVIGLVIVTATRAIFRGAWRAKKAEEKDEERANKG